MAIMTAYTKSHYDEYYGKGYWIDKSLDACINQGMERFPDKTVLVSGDVRLTFADLRDLVDRCAWEFLRLGFGKDDIVSVQLPTIHECVIAALAFNKIGVVMNPITPAYRHAEVENILRNTEPRGVMIPDEVKGFSYPEMISQIRPRLPSPIRHILVVGDDVPDGMIPFRKIIESTEGREHRAELDRHRGDPDAPLMVAFTGGTTGEPKAAISTTNSGLYTTRQIAKLFGITGNDSFLTFVPIAHAYGLLNSVCMPIDQGAKNVLLNDFDAEKALQIVQEEKISFIWGTGPQAAAMYRAYKDTGGRYDASSLRYFQVAGATGPITTEVAEGIWSDWGCQPFGMYGSTESGRPFIIPPGTPPNLVFKTDGKVLPGEQFKICDESRQEAPAGEVGELAMKGPSVFAGYYANQKRTLESFDREGFFYTGDLARLDEQGFMSIQGRTKDMIRRGGVNIYAKEIEALLNEHPKIQEAYVVGVPDERVGEKACACVIVRPDTDDLILEEMVSYLLGRGVSKIRCPEYLRIVQTFPRAGGVGRTRKFVLAEESKVALGL